MDRYLDGDEWEAFLSFVKEAHESKTPPDLDALQSHFELSQRTVKRTVRRAEKLLGLECSIPPEISRRKKAKPKPVELHDDHLTPLQRLASSIDWRYMTVLEKAHVILPGRINETKLGYTLDGKPCRVSEIVLVCNGILENEGIEKLPS